MPLLSFLQAYPAAFVAVMLLLGLIVGSFLNVVIYRLPKMMEREWRAQCAEMLGQSPNPPPERFDLWWPGSHCPHCSRSVAATDNIPIISFLMLRGRCRHCGARVAWRYPLVEILGGIVAGLAAVHYGPGIAAIAAATLGWALIALSFIDFDTQLLPDSITLPLLWLGFALSLSGVFIDLHSSVIGAMAGYLSLWSVYWLFRLFTGKEGMGHGDFKLLAMLGAWQGWQHLLLIIILSSGVGAVMGLMLIALRRLGRDIPMPFGPFLACAGWIALLWGEGLINWYWQWAGP